MQRRLAEIYFKLDTSFAHECLCCHSGASAIESFFQIRARDPITSFQGDKRCETRVRIKLQGEYRGFYAYIGKLVIVILHFFRKKTQKTPIKDLEVAQRRLKLYE